MPKLLDLTGRKFARWIVLSIAGRSSQGKSTWNCECECGTKAVVVGSSLINGLSSSCGCLAKELTVRRSTTHGLSKDGKKTTRLHRIWSNMKARCNRKNHPRYKDYGGRGIKLDEDWNCNFLSFHSWATSSGYDHNLTIERIDNNQGYSPENCKWIPAEKQARNKRDTKLDMAKVESIRRLVSGGIKTSTVAKIFSIDRHHVNAVMRGQIWNERSNKPNESSLRVELT